MRSPVFRNSNEILVDLNSDLVVTASKVLATGKPPKSVSGFLEEKLRELIDGAPRKTSCV